MQPKVILLFPTHASASRPDYQHHCQFMLQSLFSRILLLIQSHERSAHLGETCKYGVASVVAAADATAAATAAVIATDVYDTMAVAASTDGLALLKFNNAIRAL